MFRAIPRIQQRLPGLAERAQGIVDFVLTFAQAFLGVERGHDPERQAREGGVLAELREDRFQAGVGQARADEDGVHVGGLLEAHQGLFAAAHLDNDKPDLLCRLCHGLGGGILAKADQERWLGSRLWVDGGGPAQDVNHPAGGNGRRRGRDAQ